MKTLVLVFALCAVAFALPRPASEEQESKESNESKEDVLFVVPLERAMPPRGRFGGFGLNPFEQTHPFEQHPFFRGGLWGRPELEAQPEQDDFMTQMQEMLKEMRKQLTDLMQHAHHGLPGGVHGEEGGDAEAVGTRIGGGEAEQDLPQNKTTSTTKVIDGHVVTVNETTYSSGDEGLGAVFRIKIVEVKPSESPETEGENKEPEEESKDTEGEEKTSEEPSSPEREPTTSKAELPDPEEDRHEETNEIPNHTQVGGSEVDDLNA